MMRLRHKLLIHAFRIFDQVMLLGTLLVLIALLRERGSFRFLWEILEGFHRTPNVLGAVLLLLGWVGIFGYFVRYDANRFTPLLTSIRDLLKATAGCSFALFVIGELFAVSLLSNTVILLFWLGTSLLGSATRVVLRLILMALRKSGHNCRYVVFVGVNPRAVEFAQRVDARSELGYRIAGFIAGNGPAGGGAEAARLAWPVLGSLGQIKSILAEGTVDEVMICLPIKEQFRQIYEVIELCRDLGIVVRFLPDRADVAAFGRLQIELFDTDCVVTFFRENLLWQLLVKRAMDLAGSSLLLLLLAPLLAVVAVLIKATSAGPVLFRQERIGMNKRKFKLLKFRSMVANAEARRQELAGQNEQEGPVFKIKNDPRITPLGRWLRRTSIDELPQLLNVLKGEMSLVGPRPPLPSEVDQYDWLYRRRLSIKPGITCLWQVSGRSNIPFARWMELDRQYIDNWSIWLDFKILLKTIPAVLFAKGAS